jgi:hypothetical protein
MPAQVHSQPDQESSSRTRVSRARSLPSARPFRVAVLFTSLHYLAMVATLTALGMVLAYPSQSASLFFVCGLVVCAITWLVAFFKRRATSCPLCRGTPLLDTGARTHARAWRFLPLNHGTTAVVSIMCCQRFRCMYCGSDYDLLKPSSRLHGHEETEGPANYESRF